MKGKQWMMILTLCLWILSFPWQSYGEPVQGIPRASFIKTLLETLEITPMPLEVYPFEDVTPGPTADYIAAAAQMGLIAGHRGSFYPQEFISREEALVILVRAVAGAPFPGEVSSLDPLPLVDNHAFSPWAIPYVQSALNIGLLDERNGVFGPQEHLQLRELAPYLEKIKAYQQRKGFSPQRALVFALAQPHLAYPYGVQGWIASEISTQGPQGNGRTEAQHLLAELRFHSPEAWNGSLTWTTTTPPGDEATGTFHFNQQMLTDGEAPPFLGEGPLFIHPFWLKGVIPQSSLSSLGLNNATAFPFQGYAKFCPDMEKEGRRFYVLEEYYPPQSLLDTFAPQLFQDLIPLWEKALIHQGVTSQALATALERLETYFLEVLRSQLTGGLTLTYYLDAGDFELQWMNIEESLRLDWMDFTLETNTQGQIKFFRNGGFPQP